MSNWRLMSLLALLAALGGGWWLLNGRQGSAPAATAEEPAQVAYNYEARDVVLRQMGPDGRMAFQLEAREITQLPDSGMITARGLTLYHDPPDTEVGGPNRWTLTADSGELPVDGGIVTLTGKVRARGVPSGSRAAMTVATERLRYDMTTQELTSDDVVQLQWRNTSVRGRGLRANIRTGDVALESDVRGSHDP